MALFMIVSGLFAKKSFSMPFKDLLKKKTTQLLVPGWICFIGITVFTHIVSQKGFDDVKWQDFVAPYWFLTSLFFCYVVSYLASKVFSNFWVAAIISCLIMCILPPYFDCSKMLPFFWFGILIGEKLKCIDYKIALPALGLFVLLLIFWWKGEYYELPNTFVDYSEMGITPYAKDLLLKFVIGISGSITLLYVLKTIYGYIQESHYMKSLCYVGRNTLGIYLLHAAWFSLIIHTLSLTSWLAYIFVYPVITFMVVSSTIMIIRWLSNYRVLRRLIIGS